MGRSSTWVWLSVLVVTGCAEGGGTPRAEQTRGEREGTQVLAFTPYEDFVAEGGFRVSPLIPVEGGVDRLAVTAGTSDEVELVARVPGGTWQPLVQYWRGGGFSTHVGMLSGASVQVGIADADVARVPWLRVSAAHDRAPAYEAREAAPAGALDPALSHLGIVSRAGWNAEASRCGAAEADEGKDRFSIHGTLGPSDAGGIDAVVASQLHEGPGLGFCDVGVHFLVGPDGTIYEGRGLEYESGHAGDADPGGNVAIGFLGCFDSIYCGSIGGDGPTEAAIDSAAELLSQLGQRYGVAIDSSTVRGFRGCARPSTDCASDQLLAALPALISRANGGVQITEHDGGLAPDDAGSGPVDLHDAGHSHDAGTPEPPTLTCGDAGCDYCASKASCRMGGESCAFPGDVAGDRCWSSFDPCSAASCWDPTLSVPACTTGGQPEDFSSGRYNVHRYSASLPGGAPVTLTLSRTGGTFEPAMIITDGAGALIWGGDAASLLPGVTVSDAVSGRGGDRASVTLTSATALPIRVHVTGWEVVDAGFAASLATSSTYAIETRQMCMSMPPGPSASESVGSPNAGSLVNGVRITPHPGYVVPNTGRNAYWGTQETVDLIRSGFDAVRAAHPGAQVVQVRDISIQRGGAPASGPWPHSSHESGRDADLTYHLDSCSASSGCPLSDVPLSSFDVAATWTLFEHWLRQGVVTYIFVDHALQRPLYEEAMRRGATSAELSRWIQYPRASSVREGIIRHVSNHRNHHHVRFRCPSDDARCVE